MFNEKQLKVIEIGITAGLDVSIYAKPEFSDSQMSAILWGLGYGLDVSSYAKPEFDGEEMWEITKRMLDEKIKSNSPLTPP